ncbi:MAG: DnaJ C-terminal domain-containing protein [Janthinobacterium lividum]
MEFKNYYQILDVPNTATAEEIKKSYRKHARKYHPDVSKEKDAELRMKEINEAYAVLHDPEKREAYDQLGDSFEEGQPYKPPPGWDAGFEFSGPRRSSGSAPDFSDFFADFFGQAHQEGGHGSRAQKGEDQHSSINVGLADLYSGTTQTITLRGPRHDASGRLVIQDHTLSVKIPKGIRPGQQIRLSGQGLPGSGGELAGDLYLEIQLRADPRYRVEGADVFQSLPVTPWEAGLGASVETSTPSGIVNVKVPPDSQGGRQLRLKNRGIPGSPAGDLYLQLEIVLPPADSEKMRKLYETMASEISFNPRQNKGV